MRASRIGAVAVAAVLLTCSAGAAHAAWAARGALPPGVATSGDLAVSAQWVGGAPAAAALFPGQTTAPATLRVTGAGVGNTLQWRLQIGVSVATAFQPYVTLSARVGDCTTGTPIPAGGYPAGGGLAPAATVDVCVTLSLAASAPQSLSGQQMQPVLTVNAVQRSS